MEPRGRGSGLAEAEDDADEGLRLGKEPWMGADRGRLLARSLWSCSS